MIRFRRERQDWSEPKIGIEARPVVNAIRPPPQSATALELVHQAASAVQNIRDEADEATARATDVARRATELLKFAEDRIRALESAHSAAETNLRETNARLDDHEQATIKANAHISFLGQQLSAAEQRAHDAEQRALEAEDTVIAIQDAIRREFLSQDKPRRSALAAAA